MTVRVRVVVPRLWWADAPGKRVLYAGNHPDHVAEMTCDGPRVNFRVLLPGQGFPPDRMFPNRSAGEAFVYGVVEAWFKAVFA